MVVSVVFDKDLKARVFQVRDSERYTNSTQTVLNVDYLNNRTDYITITLTATVKNALGKSAVAFYCDDESVGVVNYNQGDTEAELTVKVAYGYHKYYAKYLGNAECLSSKSGISELEITEPNLPKSQFIVSVSGLDESNWASSVESLTFNASLQNKDTSVGLTDKNVQVYIDNNEIFEVTTNNEGVVPLNSITDPSLWGKGSHTLKFVFEGDVGYIGSEYEIPINLGYIVSLIRDYAIIGTGDYQTYRVSVNKPDGTPVPDITAYLKEAV